MNFMEWITIISFCFQALAISADAFSCCSRGMNNVVPRSTNTGAAAADIRRPFAGVTTGGDKIRPATTRRRIRNPNVMVIFETTTTQQQQSMITRKQDKETTSAEIRKEGVVPSWLFCINDDIYIRHAQAKDLKDASGILTNAFFRFHWFTTPLEWLKTFFSLQDSFLEIEQMTNQHQKRKKTNQEAPEEEDNKVDYKMLVACEKKNDAVVGICELDGRPRSLSNLKNTPRPYMCNLAIDEKYRQRGIGKAFVKFCEGVARDEWKESYLYLKVRVGNEIAMAMYRKLGYCVIMVEDNDNSTWKPLEQDQWPDAEDEQKVVLLRKILHES